MFSSLIFLPIRGVALPILMSIGRPQVPSIGLAVAGVANLALGISLAGPLGLVGIAIGTAVPNVIYAAMLVVVTCRALDVRVWHYVRYVVPRAVFGALPVLALLLWLKVGIDVHGFAGFAIAGLATVIVFGFTSIFFIYRKDPLVDPVPHLARVLVWTRA
jgi:O-antigen/teichoic acid export membrane protein